ncbi:TRAP transporter substrate-binding protein DctP [Paracoccus pantotrophus]|uniref:TRAP transporter substrate-binding protein DctP n=1 Tax=Paracoccus pantotrophus TaxID=82367 RepID=UPI00048AAB60|nr:TRAP transporter substrate-binding protein DctP [Paracoccus pantotrophus]
MRHLNICVAPLALVLAFGSPALGRELVYSSPVPDSHLMNSAVARRAFTHIEEQAPDTRIQLSTGGMLASFQDALASVGQGAIDGSILNFNYYPSDLAATVFLAELNAENPLEAGPAMTETMLLHCPQCLEEQKRAGVIALHNVSTDPSIIMCHDKRVETLDQFKGLKVRGLGSMAGTVAALGAVPVNIPANEVYQALQHGQIDCTAQTSSNMESFGLAEVVKYATDLPLGTSNGIAILALNRSQWDGFNAEERKVWFEAAVLATASMGVDYTETGLRIRDSAQKEKGIQYVQPDAQLSAALAAYRERERELQIQRAASRGVDNPAEIAAAYDRALEKWRGIVARIGDPAQPWDDDQRSAYEKAIRDEIFLHVPLD